jgi:hypothetical protein
VKGQLRAGQADSPPQPLVTPADDHTLPQVFERAPMPPTAKDWADRGVVISASGTVPRLAIGAYVTAYLIRKTFRSTLPIEVQARGGRRIVRPHTRRHIGIRTGRLG